MPSESGPGPLEKLATSRARFIAELGDRLAAARQGLARVGVAGSDPGAELNAVRRRLHALAAAADVLHFTTAADALRRAETELAAGVSAPSPAPARDRVTRILDLLPSLALGAAIRLDDELSSERAISPHEPLSVLLCGPPELAAALEKPGPLHGAELHRTPDLEVLPALLGQLGPDVVVIDADQPGVADLVPRLRQASAPSSPPLVAVASFESYEALQRLVRRGVARVLPAPVDAGALQRTLRELGPRGPAVPALANPLVEAGAGSLADAIASEARRAFAELASQPPVPTAALAGDPGHEALAALWSAFARIRSLVVSASDNPLDLPLAGPYGMIPLAPTLADAPGAGGAPPGIAGEALADRRLVVADTDPILLGALSRTLQRLGASVLPARDAEQALDLAERHWPDAVIADVQLPTFGGLELCRRLREDLALADMPVGLICWREDLLSYASRASDQRGGEPRPLSVAAFAPLGDALAHRLTLERRLEREGSAHGRLRGLSPRLLLELCARSGADSLLRLRSGRLTAEVAFLAGRPIHARLLDNGAPAAEAAAALSPLLGMRSGRFAIEPLASAYAAHFSGDLVTVLAAPIARARRARALLSGAGLEGLGRVELEPRVAASYLEEAPAAQRAALARLLRGETLAAVRAADASDASGASPLLAALLGLSRRGGLVALLDPSGADLLAPDIERSTSRGARSRRESPPMPAALTLAEAVLQAVSADGTGKTNGRRTQRGLAPPPAEAARATAASNAAVDTSAVDVTSEPASEAGGEPREVPEAWSSEPSARHELDSEHPRTGDELDDVPPPPTTLGSRLRSIVSPVLVTLVAAALAFAGMRVVLGGGLEGLGIAPSALLGVGALGDGGTREPVVATPPAPSPPEVPAPSGPEGPVTPPAATPMPTSAPSESASGQAAPAAASPAAADAGTPVLGAAAPSAAAPVMPGPAMPAPAAADSAGVSFTAEQLEAPASPVLPPGHGVLELQTWEPQRLYVDGVFVGNYATRLIPLTPGTYRVRFGTATRELEHPATIVAGRRTRLTARPEKAP